MKKLRAGLVGLAMCLPGLVWANTLSLTYQLFGPAQGAGVYQDSFGESCCAQWQSPTAFTSSTKTFMFSDADQRDFRWVRGLAVWIPGGPWNCMQFFYRYADWVDAGKDHPMGQFCGYEVRGEGTMLVPQGIDLTKAFNKLVKEHRDVYVGYKTWDNGSTFYIWEVRLEMFLEN